MTHNRILFLLPLMAMPLVACGNNMASIDYTATNELAENYIKTISDARLKPISSHYKLDANKLSFKGDVSYKTTDLEDFTFSAEKRTLLDVEIPTSIYTQLEEKLSRAIGSGSIPGYAIFAKYLLHPEFNPHFLTIIDGFKINEPNEKEPLLPWDKFEHLPWNTIKRTYSKSNDGSLKIDISTPSIKQTFDEVLSRFPGSGSASSLTFDAPLSASMSVDKYGYISSISLKFDCKGFKIGEKKKANKGGEGIYINGDINVDATLSFSHTFSKIVPIRYQTIEYVKDNEVYKIKEGGVSGFYDSIDDVKYKRADDTEHKVFTAEWYATNKQEGGREDYNYGCDDDPLFSYSFFDKIAKNEAFLQNNYDIVLIPDYELAEGTKDFIPQIKFLGYRYDRKSDSMCNITIDGNDDNYSTSGINENTVAGDQPVDGITIVDPDDPKSTIDVSGAYNFYIDKSLIKNEGSYYLITIAFTQDFE